MVECRAQGAGRSAKTWSVPFGSDEDPGLRLCGSDGFHPTVLGSYLAALVMYGGLANASPSGMPARLQLRNGRTVEVSAREASIAQAAAAEALR